MVYWGRVKCFINESRLRKTTIFGFIAKQWWRDGDYISAVIVVKGKTRYTSGIKDFGFRSFTTIRSGNTYRY